MLYREVGQYKSSYQADQAIFPISNDRIGIMLILIVAFVVPPAMGNQYIMGPILTQMLVFGLAALGLNLPHRICGPGLSGNRRIYGGRCIRLL